MSKRDPGKPKRKKIKRILGKEYSGNSYKEYFRTIAITIPVRRPLNGTWEEFREDIKTAWQQATAASNWVMTELYKSDVRRPKGSEVGDKMPGMDRSRNLYQEAGKTGLFDGMPRGALTQAIQSVTGKYTKIRYDVIWAGKASLPSFRYPQPFTVRSQDWSGEMGEGGHPVVCFRLPKKRWRVELKNGLDWVRPIAQFKAMIKKEVDQRVMEVHGKGSNVMIKMVLMVPKKLGRIREGSLVVRTVPNALLRARGLGRSRDGWWLSGDEIRRLVYAHEERRHRMSQDTKSERRCRKSRIRDAVKKMCDKYNNRMDTAIHQQTASLAAYAARCGVKEVLYDDSDRSFLPNWNYSGFWTRLKYKLDEFGIECIDLKVRNGEIGSKLAAAEADDAKRKMIRAALEAIAKEEVGDDESGGSADLAS